MADKKYSSNVEHKITTTFKNQRKIRLYKHKEGFNKQGVKWHYTVSTDSHKDNTGTVIYDRWYDIFFFSNSSYKDGDIVNVKNINSFTIESGYLNGKAVYKFILNVEIEENPNNNATLEAGYNQNNFNANVSDDDLPF